MQVVQNQHTTVDQHYLYGVENKTGRLKEEYYFSTRAICKND